MGELRLWHLGAAGCVCVLVVAGLVGVIVWLVRRGRR